MKKGILIIGILLALGTNVMAQERHDKKKRERFSVEEFQACQKDFITKYAELTNEEAEKFFPLFFELQKEKWVIDKEARKKAGMKRGEKCSEEKCAIMIHEIADAEIKKAELEKKYIERYLQVLPACKILRIQHAENRFQKYMLKDMWERKNKKQPNDKNK